jgi:uncharacterized membrane protein
MQSTILFAGFFVLSIVLLSTFVAAMLVPLVWLTEVVLWLLLMFKAFTGVMFKLPWVGEFAEQMLSKVAS